ncbi:hypothetical protein JB92DRAFT_2899396 [Gautieria morchelliformis]|nr:hypothetical protein JB92DRAFT_2899396 [Gautieria morchelliformis]
MNLPATRQILGVDPSVGNLTRNAFRQNLDDVSHQTQFYVAELLGRGIRVCNWVGPMPCRNNILIAITPRSATSELHLLWNVDGKPAGLTRTEEGLTFATIEGQDIWFRMTNRRRHWNWPRDNVVLAKL